VPKRKVIFVSNDVKELERLILSLVHHPALRPNFYENMERILYTRGYEPLDLMRVSDQVWDEVRCSVSSINCEG